MGSQKYCLNETVLLSTKNIMLKLKEKQIFYTPQMLSWPLKEFMNQHMRYL